MSLKLTVQVKPIGGKLRVPVKPDSTVKKLKSLVVARSKKLKEFKALGLSAAEADAIICDGLYEDGAALDSDDEVGDAISSDQVEAVLEGPRLVGSGAGRAADPGAPAVQPPPLPGSRVPPPEGSSSKKKPKKSGGKKKPRGGSEGTSSGSSASSLGELLPIPGQSAPVPPADVEPGSLSRIPGFATGSHTVCYRLAASARFVRLPVNPKTTTFAGLRRAIARVESMAVYDSSSTSGEDKTKQKKKTKKQSTGGKMKKKVISDPTSGDGSPDEHTVTMHLATRAFPLDPPTSASGGGRGGGGHDEDPSGSTTGDGKAHRLSDDLTLEEWGFTGALADCEAARSIHPEAPSFAGIGQATTAAAASMAGEPQSTTVFVTLCNRDKDPTAVADEGADGSAVTQAEILTKAAEWQPVLGGEQARCIGLPPENDMQFDPERLVTGIGGGGGGGGAADGGDPVVVPAASGAGLGGTDRVAAPPVTAARRHTRDTMLKKQTDKGMSEMLGCLLVLQNRLDSSQVRQLVGFVRRVTQFAPAAHCLSMVLQKRAITRAGKAAISSALFTIGRALLSSSVSDELVFEHARSIFSFLLLSGQDKVLVVKPDSKVDDIESTDQLLLTRYPTRCTDGDKSFVLRELHCEITNERLVDPVKVAKEPEAGGKKLSNAVMALQAGKVYTKQAALSKISKKNGGLRSDSESVSAGWAGVTAKHLVTDELSLLLMRSTPQSLTACEWRPQPLHAVDSAHATEVGLGSEDTVVAKPSASSGAGGADQLELPRRCRPTAACSANGPPPLLSLVSRPQMMSELRAKLKNASTTTLRMVPGMQRCHPSSLNDATPYSLTVDGTGRTVVYVERSKSPGKSTRVFDPLTGEWSDIDKDAVADELKRSGVEIQDDGGDMAPREPEEAVVLAVDCSASMWSYGFEDPWEISQSDFKRELRAIYDKSLSSSSAATRELARERLLNIGFADHQIHLESSDGDKFIGRLEACVELPMLRRLWTTKLSSRSAGDKFNFISRELAYLLMTPEEHQQGNKRRKLREARVVCSVYASRIVEKLSSGPGARAGGGGAAAGSASGYGGVPSSQRWQLVEPSIIGRGCPDSVRCPLSGKLYIDPVRTSNGKVYERSEIVKHLQRHEKLPGSSSRATSEEDRTLKADAEKLRAVRRWLERHSCGTADNAFGGSGHWFATRYRMNYGMGYFSHDAWKPVFVHSKTEPAGLRLLLWEQSGFDEELAPSQQTPWYGMVSSSDGFVNGQVELLSYGRGTLPTKSVGLAYTVSPEGLAWPPAVENETLDADYTQPTISSEALLKEKCGGTLAVPAGSLYICEEYDDQGNDPERKNRMLTVKVLFQAFIDRTAAFDLPHHLGLVTFSNKHEEKCGLTASFDDLRTSLEEMEEDGETAMNDAIQHAGTMLSSWKASVLARRRDQGQGHLPPPRTRIVCLSDGEDTNSTKPLHRVARKLKQDGIVLDGVLVGTSSNEELHRIAKFTGGYSFHPKTMFDGLQLCELETFLSSADRPKLRTVEGAVSSNSDLSRWSSYSVPRDVCSDTIVPQRRRDPRQTKRALPLAKAVAAVTAAAGTPAGMAPPAAPGRRSGGTGTSGGSKGAKPSSGGTDAAALVTRNRRILREMHDLVKRPHDACQVFPNQDDVGYWRVLMKGADNTPYQGGIWCLQVAFPPEYPTKAPSVRFLTPIRHVNISIQGKVCHAILDRAWTPEQTMRDVLSQIYGLMMTPEKDDPLDSNLAAMLSKPETRGKYEATVQAFVDEHAKGKTMAEWRRELTGQ